MLSCTILLQKVCGMARGYQKGDTDAFAVTFDGLSITHGNYNQHILWSYAVGHSITNRSTDNCPCAFVPGPESNSFVGSNYYCETGSNIHGQSNETVYYFSDPLWDGLDCPTTCHGSIGSWIWLLRMMWK